MTKKSFPLLATGGELKELEQPGYYVGYSTVAQKKAGKKRRERWSPIASPKLHPFVSSRRRKQHCWAQ